MPQGFKYSKQWEIEDNGLRKYYSHSRINNKSISFFVHPRLKIDKNISRHDVTINVNGTAGGFSTPTEAFNGILWNFKIKNGRYSTTVIEGCIGEVLIPNLQQRLRLTWQRPPDYELPTEYTCSAGLATSQSYRYE